jgi:hypothetical protein
MSKSSVLGIGFVLLVVGFLLGHAITPSPGTPEAPPPPTAEAPSKPRVEAREAREAVLEILRDAMRETDPFARITRLAAVLPALGPDISPEILALLEEDYTIDVGSSELDLLLRWWAKVDPRGARRWVRGTGMIPGEQTRTAQIALIRGWFHSDKPGLSEYIQQLGFTIERQRAIDVFAREMIKRDGIDAVIRWADAIPSDDVKLKLDVNRHVIGAVTRFDPAAAVAWCQRICDGPAETTTMMRAAIARRWVEQEGAVALEWLATTPAGKERDWAVRTAFRSWGDHDPMGRHAWMETLDVDNIEPWFQPAIELIVISLKFANPIEAARWAGAITDEDDHRRMHLGLARAWRERDAAAADAWMEQMEFSASMRELVLAPAPPPSPPTQPVRRPGGENAPDAAPADGNAGAADSVSPAP